MLRLIPSRDFGQPCRSCIDYSIQCFLYSLSYPRHRLCPDPYTLLIDMSGVVPDVNIGPPVVIANWTEASIAIIFVTLRIHTQINVLRRVHPEDYLIVAALVRQSKHVNLHERNANENTSYSNSSTHPSLLLLFTMVLDDTCNTLLLSSKSAP